MRCTRSCKEQHDPTVSRTNDYVVWVLRCRDVCMTFLAQVLRVFVASPGDVADERQMLADCIAHWNIQNSPSAQIVFLPVAWEELLVPELGGRPQALINSRLLQDADLLIGMFWTRLGTPTGVEVSGTVEEIN